MLHIAFLSAMDTSNTIIFAQPYNKQQAACTVVWTYCRFFSRPEAHSKLAAFQVTQ